VRQGAYKPHKAVHHTHEGSIGNLCTNQIVAKMNKVMEGISD
jgi:argininosuccinate lyase